MKIVFLDFDGVLNFDSDHPDALAFRCWLEPRLVARLNLIPLLLPEVRFVLSTSWRTYGYSYVVEEHLMPAGFAGTMHKDWATPTGKEKILVKHSRGYGHIRGDEVHTWLVRHAFAPAHDRYVILDDMRDFHRDQPLIRTNPKMGITKKDVERALALLVA